MSKTATPTGHGCTQCGAPPSDSIYVAGVPYLLCEACMPEETKDPTLDAMVNAALCSTDPAVIRAATDRFAARHNIPPARLNLPPLDRANGDFHLIKKQPATV